MHTPYQESPLPSLPHIVSTTNAVKSPTASHNPTTHKVLQSIVKGRRSWKTLGGGEIIWPPKLEAALLKGLESYQPDDSRETRLLGRFPMRNRFISDYIFSTTGKRRTAKQVGSRLQQLKITSTSNKRLLMSLVSPLGSSLRCQNLGRRARRGSDSESTSDTSTRPTTPTNIQSYDHGPDMPIIIHIDLLPDAPSGQYAASFYHAPKGSDVAQTSQQPRRLRSIDPTVTFVSRSPISARSHFTVKSAGMTIFSEATLLTPVGTASDSGSGALLFSTRLVPGWWDRILDSSDPTQYTILQEVIHDSPNPRLAFSAVYKFRYPPRSPHHRTHFPITPKDSCEGLQVKYEHQDGFNSVLHMDRSFDETGCKNVETYYNPLAPPAEPIWSSQYSPSQMSIYDQSPPSDELYEDFDFLPSPVLASFPAGYANYGAHPTYHSIHPYERSHRIH